MGNSLVSCMRVSLLWLQGRKDLAVGVQYLHGENGSYYAQNRQPKEPGTSAGSSAVESDKEGDQHGQLFGILR